MNHNSVLIFAVGPLLIGGTASTASAFTDVQIRANFRACARFLKMSQTQQEVIARRAGQATRQGYDAKIQLSRRMGLFSSRSRRRCL